ncbi:hypothetical protein SBA6_50018 [Candidatus Sulfopaludibacter sp. SbA6]|nr:hypothetical protein SBA6_50018 [Candidatus Sulfopaludibacter sp. SbA6]
MAAIENRLADMLGRPRRSFPGKGTKEPAAARASCEAVLAFKGTATFGNYLLDTQAKIPDNRFMSSPPANFPATLQEAIAYFSDPDKAFDAAVALRWPNGVTCPRCGSKEQSFISTRKIWFCKGCKKQFTVKVGSIFEDSPLGMDKWMFAAWLVGNCKNGVSSCEVARHLGITQKSAWFMDHRIRAATQSGSFNKLWGQVEADETYIGGKARNMHAHKRAKKIKGTDGKDKTAVMGILERGGEVRTKVVDNTKKKTLQSEIREHVLAGSALFTDALKSYEGLDEFQHRTVSSVSLP